jgi:hypothetical protein
MEESPGSTGIRCRLTAGGGDPRESATENKPPAQEPQGVPRARAKRCGKSAPRPWQQGRQGKPHREQDRIGAAVPQGTEVFRLAARVGRVRRAARRVPEEWPSRIPGRPGMRTEPGLQAVWQRPATAAGYRTGSCTGARHRLNETGISGENIFAILKIAAAGLGQRPLSC